MHNNIHFLGGIHCSGKGNTSEIICLYTKIIHLEASKVLKWEKISKKEDKKVQNINQTQNLLLENLNLITDTKFQYLLDGHYCLINKRNEIEKVGISTFETIRPLSLSIKVDDILEIKKRLEKRDSNNYDLLFLKKFQNLELEYAKYLSQKLDVPLFILNKEIEVLIKFINHENPS